MPSNTLTHYKVLYRVTLAPRPENNFTRDKVEYITEIDATDYDDLCKKLYHKCIVNRGIEYYEILGVSAYRDSGCYDSERYWTPMCNVAGTIFSGNGEKTP